MPAADEVYRLQTGDDAESRRFQKITSSRREEGTSITRQGLYVIAPRGTLLGSINSRDPARVAAMMRAALVAFEALPPLADKDSLAPLDDSGRFERHFPENGLVLTVVKRDMHPLLDPLMEPIHPANRDFVWFHASELEGFLPPEAVVGATRTVSATIANRLARFHLVDNIHGQSLPFAPAEVTTAQVTSKITRLTDRFMSLEISGHVSCDALGPWLLPDSPWKPTESWPRRIASSLLGTAVFDRTARVFIAFDVVALARATGKTEFNRREPDFMGFLGFHFTLAPDAPSSRVAPAFIDSYDAPWMQ